MELFFVRLFPDVECMCVRSCKKIRRRVFKIYQVIVPLRNSIVENLWTLKAYENVVFEVFNIEKISFKFRTGF